VEEFEEAFAQAVGAQYALALSSCTAALHVALMAYGIGPGDEVIVSPYTWGQSVSPVLFTGATPVFADIDPKTCTLDPRSIKERISPKTKAIIPVHIFGIPSDIDSICSIAKKHGIAVISDAAQAFGALSKGRKLGGLGDVACYSLGRGKAVCGGEGGVLVTNDREIYEKAIVLSQHPLRVFREIADSIDVLHNELNWNYRIHPFAAVLALADLKTAEIRIRHRQMVLKTVADGLDGVHGLQVLDPYHGDTPAAYGIPLTYTNQSIMPRDVFVDRCQMVGIDIRIGPIYTPIHLRYPLYNLNERPFAVAQNKEFISDHCQFAENRCKTQELLLLDVASVDISPLKNVLIIVEKIKNALHRLGHSKC
jgi:dTDP-4-amino-4,6-dideoxygalactose transaminase